MLVIHQRSS